MTRYSDSLQSDHQYQLLNHRGNGIVALEIHLCKNMENPTSPTAVEQLQKIASEFYHTFLEDENRDENSAALAVVEVVTKIAQLPVRSAHPVLIPA